MEVAATWVALRLPTALPLPAMSSPATSRAPGTEPWHGLLAAPTYHQVWAAGSPVMLKAA